MNDNETNIGIYTHRYLGYRILMKLIIWVKLLAPDVTVCFINI